MDLEHSSDVAVKVRRGSAWSATGTIVMLYKQTNTRDNELIDRVKAFCIVSNHSSNERSIKAYRRLAACFSIPFLFSIFCSALRLPCVFPRRLYSHLFLRLR